MEKLDHWVIVIDKEEGIENYLRYVSRLSQLLAPKKVDVLYNIEPDYVSEEILKDIPDLHSAEFVEVEKLLQDLINLHFVSNSEIEFVVKRGKSLVEIISHSKSTDANLVTMMSRKDDETTQLIHKVSRKAPCHVLIVPENQALELHSILVPVDYSEHSDRAYELASNITNSLDEVTMHAYHAYHDASKYVNQVFETAYEVNDYYQKKPAIDNTLEKHAKHKLAKYASENSSVSDLATHTDAVEKGQNVGEKIKNWIEVNRPDLVVLGSKGQSNALLSLSGMVSEYVYTHAKQLQPILIVKKQGENSNLIKALLGI